MFSRAFIAVAMSAVLLACPILGAGECCAMSHNHESLTTHDGDLSRCCHASHDAHDRADDYCPPADQHCPDGCDAADCICNGAILVGESRCPNCELDNGFFSAADIQCVHLSVATSRLATRQLVELAAHFPPHLSGRDISTLVCSRLL